MANKAICTKFDELTNTSVLEEVSKAIIALRNDLKYTNEETSEEIINEKIDELKRTINTYIDGQKVTLIKLQKG